MKSVWTVPNLMLKREVRLLEIDEFVEDITGNWNSLIA